MTRAVKIYLLVVVLPAALLVAGGIRLVSLEADRARASVVESLTERAHVVARAVSERIRAADPSAGRPRPPHPHKPPRPPDGGGGAAPQRPAPGAVCREHALAGAAKAAALEAIEALKAESDGPARIVEIRHVCGCVVVPGEKPITGEIVGKAFLRRCLPGYHVVVAPVGGDAEVESGLKARSALYAILLLLLCATMSAGVALLVRSAKKARDEARRKTDFLSNVSHELKTPLTSISMFAEMLAGGALDAEAASRAASGALRETRRLALLIDGLLEYARLERGARKFDIEDFCLDSLLAELSESFAPSFPKGLNTDGGGLRVRADREAVRRILDCIVENAAKYAADGGPVEVRAAPAANGRIAVSVADSGPGMSAGDAKRAFDRFWRADDSVTRTTGGAGLGLSIARELARGMGGDVTLAANEPHGCVFTLAITAGKEADRG